MKSPKLPGGPAGKIRLLGGAAPLSSQKIGYLLRVAHMIPIIFSAGLPVLVLRGQLPLIGFTYLAKLI